MFFFFEERYFALLVFPSWLRHPPFFFYCLGFSLFCSGNYVILAPYAALVPDVIPADQRGVASG